jgi:hypothetical protein
MRLALGQPLPPSISAPTEPGDAVATGTPTGSADHTMKDMPK